MTIKEKEALIIFLAKKTQDFMDYLDPDHGGSDQLDIYLTDMLAMCRYFGVDEQSANEMYDEVMERVV